MSEDDRAAKAARAKAMLKKRQQKKGADAPADANSPAGTPARVLSPLPRQGTPAIEEPDQRRLADMFPAEEQEPSWLQQAPEPIAAPSTQDETTGPPSNTRMQPSLQEPALQVEIQKLRADINAKDQGLNATRKQVELLEARLAKALSQHRESVQELEDRLSILTEEKDRALEAEGQSAKQYQELSSEATGLRQKLETLENAHSELEKEIKNQQRTIELLVSEKASLAADLERLEHSEIGRQKLSSQLAEEQEAHTRLRQQYEDIQEMNRATERRAEELEASEKDVMDKYKDTYRQLQVANGTISEIRSEVENSERKLRELEERFQNDSDERARRLEDSLQSTQDRADALESQLSKLKQTHGSLKSEKEAADKELEQLRQLSEEFSNKMQAFQTNNDNADKRIGELIQEVDALRKERDGLSMKLEEATKSNASNSSTLSALSIQHESTSAELKRSIKRVEELEALQRNLQAEGNELLKSLDEVRPKLVQLSTEKAELGERVSGLEHSVKSRDALIAQLEADLYEVTKEKQERDKATKDVNTTLEKERQALRERERAEDELRASTESLQTAVRSLESEKTAYNQELKRRSQEVEQLKASVESYKSELDSARRMLDERIRAQDEERALLQDAHNELEALVAELEAKKQTIENLQRGHSSSAGPTSPSLGGELFSSLQQRHSLELSEAQSRIRELETAAFNADARSHALQKQVSMLEDRLSHLKVASSISRPTSSALSVHDHRPRSALSNRPGSSLSRTLTVYDQELSPEARHKRHVSLGLLRARLDSEMAHIKSLAATREETPLTHFLDESHVFFCSSCEGDLVVL